MSIEVSNEYDVCFNSLGSHNNAPEITAITTFNTFATNTRIVICFISVFLSSHFSVLTTTIQMTVGMVAFNTEIAIGTAKFAVVGLLIKKSDLKKLRNAPGVCKKREKKEKKCTKSN